MDYPGLSWKPMSDEEKRMLNMSDSWPEYYRCQNCIYFERCEKEDVENCEVM